VKRVGPEELASRPSVGCQHRRVDIDVRNTRLRGSELLDQRVGVADLRQQRGARRAGFDRDKGDPSCGQGQVNALHEGLELAQHIIGRPAFGQVVVAGVDQHHPRPIPYHQAIEIVHAVGQPRSPEAAIDDHRQGRKIGLQAIPQTDR